MNLNKENLKKIRGLIVFTVILLIALWNYSLILDVLGQGVGIVYPFLLGGAIAFVINVPMSFFEEKLFQNQMMKNKKVAQRLARPVSLIITLIVVVSDRAGGIRSASEAGGHFYIDRERNTVIYAESAELGRRDFP